TRRAQRHVHVGEFSLHKLEFANGFAELLALMDIGNDHIKARRHDAKGSGRKHDALIVETRHQNANARTFLSQSILERHLAILKNEFTGVGTPHAELVEFW